MRPQNFDPQVVVDALQGTCDTLEGALEECYPGMEFIDLTSEDHAHIDQEIFLCAECGWWYEQSESAENDEDENLCQGCVDVR